MKHVVRGAASLESSEYNRNPGVQNSSHRQDGAAATENEGLEASYPTTARGGYGHTVLLLADGSVLAIGDNFVGQLGDGTKISKQSFVHVLAEGEDIAAGYDHTLILKNDGSVHTVGGNEFGQLGDNTTRDKNSFVQVLQNEVSAIAAGLHHTVIMKQDGSVHTVGANDLGQLGDGTNRFKQSFVQVLSHEVVRGAERSAVAAGQEHTVVLKSDGSVHTVGGNAHGQLGDGTNIGKQSFRQVMRGGGFHSRWFSDIAAGGFHTLILRGGAVHAVGRNDFGQLGDGSKTDKLSFVTVMKNGVSDVAAGTGHTVLLKIDGSVYAVGDNRDGQLGDGTNVGKDSFVKVANEVVAIAAGSGHTIILKSAGSVFTTGRNWIGQLGDGTTIDKQSFVQANTIITQATTSFHQSATSSSSAQAVLSSTPLTSVQTSTTMHAITSTMSSSQVALPTLGKSTSSSSAQAVLSSTPLTSVQTSTTMHAITSTMSSSQVSLPTLGKSSIVSTSAASTSNTTTANITNTTVECFCEGLGSNLSESGAFALGTCQNRVAPGYSCNVSCPVGTEGTPTQFSCPANGGHLEGTLPICAPVKDTVAIGVAIGVAVGVAAAGVVGAGASGASSIAASSPSDVQSKAPQVRTSLKTNFSVSWSDSIVGDWQELGGEAKFRLVANIGWLRWCMLLVASKVLHLFHFPFPSYEVQLVLIEMQECCGKQFWTSMGSQTHLSGDIDSDSLDSQGLMQWRSPTRWTSARTGAKLIKLDVKESAWLLLPGRELILTRRISLIRKLEVLIRGLLLMMLGIFMLQISGAVAVGWIYVLTGLVVVGPKLECARSRCKNLSCLKHSMSKELFLLLPVVLVLGGVLTNTLILRKSVKSESRGLIGAALLLLAFSLSAVGVRCVTSANEPPEWRGYMLFRLNVVAIFIFIILLALGALLLLCLWEGVQRKCLNSLALSSSIASFLLQICAEALFKRSVSPPMGIVEEALQRARRQEVVAVSASEPPLGSIQNHWERVVEMQNMPDHWLLRKTHNSEPL